MADAFLDTTVVVHLSDAADVRHPAARSAVAALGTSEAPVYALREMLAGPLQILCDLHNRINASETIGEVLLALAKLNPIMGRKKSSQIEAFARELARISKSQPHTSLRDALDDIADSVALQAARVWGKAQEAHGWDYVQPLGCFSLGKLSIGEDGEIVPPNGSFNCDKAARCSAATYMTDQGSAVGLLCDALHPDKVSPSIRDKSETKSRRAALKDLRDNGPKRFHKKGCRALGDAYFAVMCPATSDILTTNIADFEPLCDALKKRLKVL